MSNHVNLTLHYPEESVVCDFAAALTQFPKNASVANPITDYFHTSAGLIMKIVDTKYSNDSEILGLLVLGVVSCAEFYFRSVLSELTSTCPLSNRHTESLVIPAGSTAFYQNSGFNPLMSAFEHESLADSKKITAEIKRFGGFSCGENSSIKKALDDFELLCELRHCFIHARGFAGLKAVRAIGGPRSLQKVLIQQEQALDFIKLSHNAVRAVNRYLSDEVLNRWIDKDVLTGNWTTDKRIFTRYVKLFSMKNEDAYGGVPQKIYAPVRPIVLKRKQRIPAKVATKNQEPKNAKT